jgi:hypothetical protein
MDILWRYDHYCLVFMGYYTFYWIINGHATLINVEKKACVDPFDIIR